MLGTVEWPNADDVRVRSASGAVVSRQESSVHGVGHDGRIRPYPGLRQGNAPETLTPHPVAHEQQLYDAAPMHRPLHEVPEQGDLRMVVDPLCQRPSRVQASALEVIGRGVVVTLEQNLLSVDDEDNRKPRMPHQKGQVVPEVRRMGDYQIVEVDVAQLMKRDYLHTLEEVSGLRREGEDIDLVAQPQVLEDSGMNEGHTM